MNMSHRLQTGIVVLLLAVMSFGAVQSARAVESGSIVLTQAQITEIEQRCTESKIDLRQLHTADGIARVNLVHELQDVGSRLMAPLNSRIALNGLDGVELAQTTVDYNKTLDEFTDAYQRYYESVEATLEVNCEDDPVAYYSNIQNARRLRANTQDEFTKLQDLIRQYDTQFNAFRKGVLETQG